MSINARDVIRDAIYYEPYIDHGEAPSAEQYADAVINELHRHGYTIIRTKETA